MALFDSPNDMQWNNQVHSFNRTGTQTYVGKILDERGDGNYLDNMFQKYTVELIGWGQKVYNCKVAVPMAGYNGTGYYKHYKVNDVVVVSTKEGQLDEAIILGSMRLNGDLQKLEVEGQAQVHGEHYVGPRQRVAPSNPPAIHPARSTKPDGDFYIGGVNNVREAWEDPTEVTDLPESLNKQPLPGVLKYTTNEGVDVNYSLGGMVNMTDGHFIVMSSGTTQSKCTKFARMAERHTKISVSNRDLATYRSTNTFDAQELQSELTNEVGDVDLEAPIGEEGPISITADTPLFQPSEGQAASIDDTARDLEAPEAQARSASDDPETALLAEEGVESEEGVFVDPLELPPLTVRELGSGVFRSERHTELAEDAMKAAEACNAMGAAYQYSSLLMGNATTAPTISVGGSAPLQSDANVDPNNYSSRNGGEPKPPTVIKPAHPTNYTNVAQAPNTLVMHHSVSTMEQMTRDFQTKGYGAAAHYAVGRDGTVVQYVPDLVQGGHVKDHNPNKIGIEIVATKPGHGMTQAQEASLIKLSRFIVTNYDIKCENVKGHNEFMATKCPTWVFPTKQSLRDWVDKNLKPALEGATT